jgi:hypothetical protein
VQRVDPPRAVRAFPVLLLHTHRSGQHSLPPRLPMVRTRPGPAGHSQSKRGRAVVGSPRCSLSACEPRAYKTGLIPPQIVRSAASVRLGTLSLSDGPSPSGCRTSTIGS